jgi:GT2 family glycosyltransferase
MIHSNSSITVVIPTYKRCQQVQRLLAALGRQQIDFGQVEVIVSIDGSEDGTRELVTNFSAPYRLHTLWQPNRGRAAACNAGIRQATGDLVILLDDDMEPFPEFLAAHRLAHLGKAQLGVIGAVPIHLDEASSATMRFVGAKFNAHLGRLAEPNHRLQLRDFYSGNFSIQRQVMLDVGLFDEAFTIYGNEDVELCVRLQEAGVKLIYSAEAAARQHYTKDFAGLARDNQAKGRTSVLLASKHPQVFGELKLSLYHQGSGRWRMARRLLLDASKVWPRTPDALIGIVARLERRWPQRMQLYYGRIIFGFILDTFYWLGVRAALCETGITDGRFKALSEFVGRS